MWKNMLQLNHAIEINRIKVGLQNLSRPYVGPSPAMVVSSAATVPQAWYFVLSLFCTSLALLWFYTTLVGFHVKKLVPCILSPSNAFVVRQRSTEPFDWYIIIMFSTQYRRNHIKANDTLDTLSPCYLYCADSQTQFKQ